MRSTILESRPTRLAVAASLFLLASGAASAQAVTATPSGSGARPATDSPATTSPPRARTNPAARSPKRSPRGTDA